MVIFFLKNKNFHSLCQETKNEPLLEELLDIGIQEKEGQAEPNSLAHINAEQQSGDDPMADNQTDTQPANETTCENDGNTPEIVNDQRTVEEEQNISTQNSEARQTISKIVYFCTLGDLFMMIALNF